MKTGGLNGKEAALISATSRIISSEKTYLAPGTSTSYLLRSKSKQIRLTTSPTATRTQVLN